MLSLPLPLGLTRDAAAAGAALWAGRALPPVARSTRQWLLTAASLSLSPLLCSLDALKRR